MNEIRQLAEPAKKALWIGGSSWWQFKSSTDSINPTAPVTADIPDCPRSAARQRGLC